MLYPIVDGFLALTPACGQNPQNRLERPQTEMIGSTEKTAGRSALLVLQRFHGVQLRGACGGNGAEDHADQHCRGQRDGD